MLEWRPMAVSRFLIVVIVGSQGVFVSYMPNWTVQGATAALAGCEAPPRAMPAADNATALTADATRRFMPTRIIRPPALRLHCTLVGRAVYGINTA
jgi:hypothetical protein